MLESEMRSPRAMVILPCPTCGRSVKVLGRVRRVLCGCGQVLMEVAGGKPTSADASASEALKVR